MKDPDIEKVEHELGKSQEALKKFTQVASVRHKRVNAAEENLEAAEKSVKEEKQKAVEADRLVSEANNEVQRYTAMLEKLQAKLQKAAREHANKSLPSEPFVKSTVPDAYGDF